jgi:tetratricopeptide (TPR) repeat protein
MHLWPSEDEFGDEYQCPYCAAQTVPQDRTCPACGKPLWVVVRRREQRSSWLWAALTLQAASTIWPAFMSLVMIFYAAYLAGVDNFFELIPLYAGLPNQIPAETSSAVFESMPRLYVLPFVVYSLFSLIMMVGLYMRRKPIFYLFLVSTLVTLGVAIAGVVIGPGLPDEGIILNPRVGALCGGSGLILALLMFLLILRIEDDFFFDEKRLLLRHDRDASNGLALLDSGRRYARQNMWAMAVIHFRKAAVLSPYQIEPHLALSAAYLKLKRHALAASALEEARRIAPDHPQVQQLTALLKERQP